jgi:hypothetical protein
MRLPPSINGQVEPGNRRAQAGKADKRQPMSQTRYYPPFLTVALLDVVRLEPALAISGHTRYPGIVGISEKT